MMVMKILYFFTLLLWSLLLVHQTARADGVIHLAFDETFSSSSVQGGRDGNFSAGSGKPYYDIEGWSGSNDTKIYGASKCIRFGTSDTNGSCTTPEIILIGTGKMATLTFEAAGWISGTNTLTVTANEGVTLSGNTQITLTNGSWTAYTVNITQNTATYVQLTFTGKRGFLDDVKVEETVTAIDAPTLTDEFSFWPNTTEANAAKTVTLAPSDSTTVYYTTDGSTPSNTNGQVATLTSNVAIMGTTTVKAIAYYETVASSVVSKTYTQGTTVNSISAFRNLSDNAEARLYLADDGSHESRVLYYDATHNELYVRDKTGSLCIDFGETATFNPIPQYNQHVAGWIVGKKVTDNGLPKLLATSNTNTDYLAIAAPVTESQTEPASISNTDIDSHLADWVTVNEQRVGTDLAVSNRFGTDVYDGALADLSGIVISNDGVSQIAPITQNDIPAVVYVLDEQQAFVSPSSDIDDVTIRLKRTLSSSSWNTFAVPFDITTINGRIREYDHADGTTMVFTDVSAVEAGKPYLVKPADDIVNPVYSNVTLSATPARTITDGGYSFVAIYSPTDLATDHTEQFLKTDGKLYYPTASGTRMRGMRAFFRTPVAQGARLAGLDETTTDIVELKNSSTEGLKDSGMEELSFFDLQGRRVSGAAKKGIYIMRSQEGRLQGKNGKKIVIR